MPYKQVDIQVRPETGEKRERQADRYSLAGRGSFRLARCLRLAGWVSLSLAKQAYNPPHRVSTQATAIKWPAGFHSQAPGTAAVAGWRPQD